MSSKEKKLASVEAEIARERAESLARGAQRLRASLAALHSFDAGTGGPKPRRQLVAEASEACLSVLVQREVLGLGARDAESLRKEFEVPADVWNAMGALRAG